MAIIILEREFPSYKNDEVVAAWLRAMEKYPEPEGLYTTLIQSAMRGTKTGLKSLSAYLLKPGKFDEAVAYLIKFNSEFLKIEGYTYEFTDWSTLEESLASIGFQK